MNSTVPSGLVMHEDVVHGMLALAHIHSAINPFLYAFNIKDFRQEFGKILKYGDHDFSTSSS